MFLLHHFQFFDNDQPILRSQLVACTAFPQAVLVCKGNKNLIIIHHIRHDVTGLNVYRIGLQVKAFAQGRNVIRHVLCTLLGSMSSSLGIKIKQRIPIYHNRNAPCFMTQGVNTPSLTGQFHRIGRICSQFHLFNLHPEIGFIQPGSRQFLFHGRQVNRI